jgi:hypothetical protein
MDKFFQFTKATLKDTNNTEKMSFNESPKLMSMKEGEPSFDDQIKATRRAQIDAKIQEEVKKLKKLKAKK